MSIKYLGDYIPTSCGRAANESFWSSDVTYGRIKRQVVDAAGIDKDGNDVVRLIPYGNQGQEMADALVSNGDLLAYVRKRNDVRASLDLTVLRDALKGRASHAELAYLSEDGRAKHLSLWDGPPVVIPKDGMFADNSNDAALAIYRVSLKEFGVDPGREKLLKAGVRRWKEVIRPVYFPNGDALNYDPVDFADVEALGSFARKFVQHAPDDPRPPVECKFNCVQWSTLAFSLAMCYPLTEAVLGRLGVKDCYDRQWKDRLMGYEDPMAVALDVLPIHFYTPMEILEDTLDLYLPECKDELLARVASLPVEEWLGKKGLSLDSRLIMPSSFILENRLRTIAGGRRSKAIFEYVATALPESEVAKRQ